MVEEIIELVAKARAAQAEIEFWSQEKVDEMVAAVGWEAYERSHAEACANLAIDETGMGIIRRQACQAPEKNAWHLA